MSTLNSVRPLTAVETEGWTRHTPTVVKASRPQAELSDRDGHARRRHRGVAPHRDRRGAGVARLALESHHPPLDPEDPVERREPQSRPPRAAGPARCAVRRRRRSTTARRRQSAPSRARRRARRRRRPAVDRRCRPGRRRRRRRACPPPPPTRTASGRNVRLPRRPSRRRSPTPAVRPRRGARPRSTSAPASTPRQPSSQPPLGTESRWLPSTIRSGRAPGSVTQRLPAGSMVVSTGMSSNVEANHSRARTHGSVHASRALPERWARRTGARQRSAGYRPPVAT